MKWLAPSLMLGFFAVRLFALEIGADGGSTYVGTSGEDTLTGSTGNDLLVGLDDSDDISGGDGDDVLFGGSHADDSDLSSDTLEGGTGDDWLFGGLGGDLYYYFDGDGVDTIVETRTASGNVDVLSFGPDIDPADVAFEIEGADLVITHLSTDIFRIRHWYLSRDGSTQVEQIVFDDSTLIEPDDLPFSGNEVAGTSSGETLNGTTGQINRIFGGDGNDIIYGKDLDDVIAGESGNDTIHGNDGSDVIAGDAGNDTLNGNNGSDELVGGDGVDTLNGGSGDDRLWGGVGNDTLIGQSGSDRYYWNLGDGDDIVADDFFDISAGIFNRVIFGVGVAPGDVRGDAVVSAPNDVKFVISQSGVDVGSVRINGWAQQYAGVYHSTRWIFEFADGTIWSAGKIATHISDRLEGSSGVDTFSGLGGADVINGYGGADTIDGGDGNDIISGGDGDDTLSGGGGADYISGDNGNDTLNGGTDADTLLGGAGDDHLLGGAGADTLQGGNGSDKYYWNLGDGEDSIADNVNDIGAGVFNRVIFGSGITPSDVRGDAVSGAPNDVEIRDFTERCGCWKRSHHKLVLEL